MTPRSARKSGGQHSQGRRGTGAPRRGTANAWEWQVSERLERLTGATDVETPEIEELRGVINGDQPSVAPGEADHAPAQAGAGDAKRLQLDGSIEPSLDSLRLYLRAI